MWITAGCSLFKWAILSVADPIPFKIIVVVKYTKKGSKEEEEKKPSQDVDSKTTKAL